MDIVAPRVVRGFLRTDGVDGSYAALESNHLGEERESRTGAREENQKTEENEPQRHRGHRERQKVSEKTGIE